MIKTVVVDLGGVLFSEGKSVALDKLAAAHGYDRSLVGSILSSPQSILLRQGLMTDAEFCQWAQQQLPSSYDSRLIKNEWYNGEIYAQPVDRFVADFIGLMNFVPGRIISRSGEEATVEFLGGHRLNVMDRSGLTGECVVAVRPEDISLSPAGPIRCRVEVSNYSGHLIDYKVRSDGVVLRVQTPKTIYKEGEELGFNIERAMLFAACPS